MSNIERLREIINEVIKNCVDDHSDIYKYYLDDKASEEVLGKFNEWIIPNYKEWYSNNYLMHNNPEQYVKYFMRICNDNNSPSSHYMGCVSAAVGHQYGERNPKYDLMAEKMKSFIAESCVK